MKHYLLQVLIAADQLFCALIGGWADESLSAYAWRKEQNGSRAGRIARQVIDGLFMAATGEVAHCYNAYEAERRRAQLPPELRMP